MGCSVNDNKDIIFFLPKFTKLSPWTPCRSVDASCIIAKDITKVGTDEG